MRRGGKFGRLPDPRRPPPDLVPLNRGEESSYYGGDADDESEESRQLFYAFEEYLREVLYGSVNSGTVCSKFIETREGIMFDIYGWSSINNEFIEQVREFPYGIANVNVTLTDDNDQKAVVNVGWLYDDDDDVVRSYPHYPTSSPGFWNTFINRPKQIILAMAGTLGIALLSTSTLQWRNLSMVLVGA